MGRKPIKVKAPPRPVLSVRFEPPMLAALEKAAKADTRPVSSMAQKIIGDWLKANGFLK